MAYSTAKIVGFAAVCVIIVVLICFCASSSSPVSAGEARAVSEGDRELSIVLAHWCGWSKKTYADFRKVANKSLGLGLPEDMKHAYGEYKTKAGVLHLVDGTVEEPSKKNALHAKYGAIRGYPTIFMKKNAQKLKPFSRDEEGYAKMCQFLHGK